MFSAKRTPAGILKVEGRRKLDLTTTSPRGEPVSCHVLGGHYLRQFVRCHVCGLLACVQPASCFVCDYSAVSSFVSYRPACFSYSSPSCFFVSFIALHSQHRSIIFMSIFHASPQPNYCSQFTSKYPPPPETNHASRKWT